ncbi:MAG: DUF1367 family protein [Bacteroidetes bacterium]|nr:DUF1367 family protein [Bacteroidota bacterium]
MEFFANISKPNYQILPLYTSDQEELIKLKQNTEYKFVVTKPRNYKFHKKFFALLNLGFQNQDKLKTFEEYRIIKTMQSGFFKMIITDKGKVFIPESISFCNMDEIEFETLFKTVMEIICTDTKITEKEVIQELINFM